MASDGCDEVAWKGRAFPYLLHHPGGVTTENYGTARLAAQQAPAGGHAHGRSHTASCATKSSDALAPAGTGTWNGPAPRSQAAANKSDTSCSTSAVVKEPATVCLCNGAVMPMLGMDTSRLESADAVRSALDIGFRFFDCSAYNGKEGTVGEGLQDFIQGGRRSELFISSKAWQNAHRPELLRSSLESSLQRLNCHYLDLYLLHWPEAWSPDSPDADPKGQPVPDSGITLEQTWRGMEALVDAGLVRAIGICNCSLEQVESILGFARIKPAVVELELHPLLSQRKIVGVCFRKGVQCVAYSVLGGEASQVCAAPVVKRIAAELNRTPAQVAVRWSLQRGVPALVEPGTVPDVAGLFSWRFSNAQKAELDALEAGRRFVDYPWKTWADPELGGVTKPSKVMNL